MHEPGFYVSGENAMIANGIMSSPHSSTDHTQRSTRLRPQKLKGLERESESIDFSEKNIGIALGICPPQMSPTARITFRPRRKCLPPTALHSQLLREGFEREVLLHGEEVEANARENLEDIESQGRGCRPGAYGRKLQFADPDFPPDNSSVGNAQCRQQLASQWKVGMIAY